MYFFFHGVTAPSGPVHPHYRRYTITQAHHNRYDSSGRVISPIQRPLPDNTQHSKDTDIRAPGGIRTHNPRRREAADPSLRPCGQWDRPVFYIVLYISKSDIAAVDVIIYICPFWIVTYIR
jgi:hypothetical protein